MKMKKTTPPTTVAKQSTPSKPKISAPAPAKAAITSVPSLAAKPALPKKSEKPETSTPKSVARLRTTVEAIVNVGFGNALFIRGEGPGLSWEKGFPMNCIGESRWVWANTVAEKAVVFKLVLNDTTWCQGENLIAAPGQKLETAPVF
jgi:hypothetical protein